MELNSLQTEFSTFSLVSLFQIPYKYTKTNYYDFDCSFV